MEKIASLKHKVVIITGGTRGIGFAAVQGFLRSGAKVAMLGSRKETVDHALDLLNPNYPVQGYYPDLNSEQEVQHLLEEVEKDLGSVDILINNAGISDAKSIYEYDDEHFSKVMQLNVDAVFRMIRMCAPIMKKKGKGAIVNTSSMVSLYAQRSGSAYPTSKFAINGLTKSLARELGKDGIRVNAVAPGIIETDMVKELDERIIQAMASQIPLQRIGQPEDIAHAMMYLASDMASFVNGAILSVDGGFVG